MYNTILLVTVTGGSNRDVNFIYIYIYTKNYIFLVVTLADNYGTR